MSATPQNPKRVRDRKLMRGYCRGWRGRNIEGQRKREAAVKRERRKDASYRAATSAYLKEWRKRNRLKLKSYAGKYRALKRASAVNLRGIKAFVARVRSKPFARCYYCDTRITIKAVHFDHIIPLSKGGPHTVENLCVCCAFCNSSKGARPVAEWTREAIAQQLLPL